MKRAAHALRRQRGISLTVALLFLLAIGILGIAAINSTTSQERMARYDRDHAIALAAAEVALRDAEQDVRLTLSGSPYTASGVSRALTANSAAATNFSCSCGSDLGATQHGLCLPVTTTSCTSATDYPWNIASNWTGNGSVALHSYTAASGTTNLPLTSAAALGSSRAPRYMIEIIADTDTTACSAKATAGCTIYRYRLTARGWGPNAGYATLQETYQP